MVIADSMPPNSDNVPFIAAYYFSTMLIISLVTTCTVLTSNISRFGENEKPVPLLIQRIFFDKISKYFFMNIKYDRQLRQSVKEFFSSQKFNTKSKSKFSPYINNACHYEMNNKEHSLLSSDEFLILKSKKHRKTLPNSKKTSLMNDNNYLENKREITDLVQLLKKTTEENNLKISVEEYKAEITNQWKQLARIIDNCLGLIFVITTLFLFTLTSLFFYMNVYKHDLIDD